MKEDKTKAKVKQDFLLLLLREIEQNGNNLKQLALNVKWSKQRLNYHLNRKLKNAGFVIKTQSYPFAIYSLTPLGQRVKQIIEQSEGVKPLWRCHALIVAFDIEDFGNFKFEGRKLSPMRNWNYTEEKVKDHIGEWKLAIQDTGLLKIYVPEQYSDNPDETFGGLERLASIHAKRFAESYGMKLGLLKQIREGHKERMDSEKLGKLLGHTRIGDVWADASTGTMMLEEKQSSTQIEALFQMPNTLKSLDEKLTPAIEKLTEQIELHLTAIQELRDAVKELRDVEKDKK